MNPDLHLGLNPDLARAPDRWIGWYLDYVHQHGGKDRRNWAERFAPLAEEWPNLVRVFAWCRRQGRYDALKRFWNDDDGVDWFADLYGHWSVRFATLLWLGYEAECREDGPTAVRAFSNAGWIRSLRGDREQAYGLLQKASEHCEHGERWDLLDKAVRLEHLENQAEYAIRWTQYEQAHQHLADHEALCQRLMAEATHPDAAPVPGLLDDILPRARANRCYYQAVIYTKTDALAQALYLFADTERQGERYDYERASLYSRNWLADLAILQGQFAEADGLLCQVETTAELNHDIRRSAYAAKSRANYAFKTGDPQRARASCDNAKIGFTTLGMVQEAAEVERLLVQYATMP